MVQWVNLSAAAEGRQTSDLNENTQTSRALAKRLLLHVLRQRIKTRYTELDMVVSVRENMDRMLELINKLKQNTVTGREVKQTLKKIRDGHHQMLNAQDANGRYLVVNAHYSNNKKGKLAAFAHSERELSTPRKAADAVISCLRKEVLQKRHADNSVSKIGGKRRQFGVGTTTVQGCNDGRYAEFLQLFSTSNVDPNELTDSQQKAFAIEAKKKRRARLDALANKIQEISPTPEAGNRGETIPIDVVRNIKRGFPSKQACGGVVLDDIDTLVEEAVARHDTNRDNNYENGERCVGLVERFESALGDSALVQNENIGVSNAIKEITDKIPDGKLLLPDTQTLDKFVRFFKKKHALIGNLYIEAVTRSVQKARHNAISRSVERYRAYHADRPDSNVLNSLIDALRDLVTNCNGTELIQHATHGKAYRTSGWIDISSCDPGSASMGDAGSMCGTKRQPVITDGTKIVKSNNDHYQLRWTKELGAILLEAYVMLLQKTGVERQHQGYKAMERDFLMTTFLQWFPRGVTESQDTKPTGKPSKAGTTGEKAGKRAGKRAGKKAGKKAGKTNKAQKPVNILPVDLPPLNNNNNVYPNWRSLSDVPH